MHELHDKLTGRGKKVISFLGHSHGGLTQYKPDLKEAKTIPAPPGGDFTALSILWVSNYQFVVAFKNKQEEEGRTSEK